MTNPSEKEKSVEIIYDTENSIVFEDYLDLMLNKNERFYDDIGDKEHKIINEEKWESATKLEQFEYIHYSYRDEEKKLKEVKGGEPSLNNAVFTGGLKLPKKNNHVGSGNIVIIGNPGSGKSTLAFQIAAACTSEINNGIAIYYSLEVTPKDMIANMMHKRAEDKAKIWFYLPKESEHGEPSSGSLCGWLEKVLKGSEGGSGKITPQILLPAMSPRGLTETGESHRLFIDRYTELEMMLKAIDRYNEAVEESNNIDKPNKNKEKKPLIKVVVIDSLNAFGSCPLSREELFRLFDLFHNHSILGVFTLENSEIKEAQNENQLISETAKYMSDVVISLEKEIYNDYTCQYFEVEKSRYVSQVMGKHPYKIAGIAKSEKDKDEKDKSEKDKDKKNYKKMLRKCIEIAPSLHYRIFASETKSVAKKDNNDTNSETRKGNLFGIEALDRVLPNHFKEREKGIPQIITINGKSGHYKSDIAINALFTGLLSKENGLIIRMNDRSVFSSNGMRLHTDVLEKLSALKYTKTDEADETDKEVKKIIMCEQDISEEIHRSEHKYTGKSWLLKKEEDKEKKPQLEGKNEEPQLIEIAFKSGALLPEEFIEEVCRIINRYNIKRVAFTDIKAIGVSYPFLINSKTSGNIFLSVFIHIMRNYGVHVIMSSSESGYKPSDNEMHKTSILSDAVITLKGKKDNENEIVIEGEGLITEKGEIFIHIDKEKGQKYRFCFTSPDKPDDTTSPFETFTIEDPSKKEKSLDIAS